MTQERWASNPAIWQRLVRLNSLVHFCCGISKNPCHADDDRPHGRGVQSEGSAVIQYIVEDVLAGQITTEWSKVSKSWVTTSLETVSILGDILIYIDECTVRTLEKTTPPALCRDGPRMEPAYMKNVHKTTSNKQRSYVKS